jgi:hypothetical protein
MERLGLVGLPNSGKTSLFNALTGADAPVAAHPFTTTESAQAAAPLPDRRLDALAAMSHSRKVVRAGVEVVDIAGLVSGSSTGEGLGNRFLAGIREVDALCLVLRAFGDLEVVGESDPLQALGVLELELVLADVATVEAQLDKRRKAARADKSLAAEVAAMQAALQVLSSGTPLYRAGPDDAEQRAIVAEVLALAEQSLEPGEIVDLPFRWPEKGWEAEIIEHYWGERETVRSQRAKEFEPASIAGDGRHVALEEARAVEEMASQGLL